MEAQVIESGSRSQGGWKLLAGIFFTLFGIVLTAGNLDLLESDRYLRFWPAVIVAAGAIKLFEPGQALFGILIILAGSALLGFTLGWLRFTIWDLWPLLLIILGLSMVMRSFGFAPAGHFPENFSLFSARTQTVSSEDYRGGSAAAVFGSVEMDLTRARIRQSPVVLNVGSLWGSVELTVPEDWDVVCECIPVMAGVEVKTKRSAVDARQQLIVRGFALMAGVEVKSAPRRVMHE